MDEGHELAEALAVLRIGAYVDAGGRGESGERAVGRHTGVTPVSDVDVDDGAAAHLRAGVGVVVGRAARLDNVGTEEAVVPAPEVDVVVPEDGARVHVGIPAVLHELHAYALAHRVGVVESCVQRDVGAVDRLNTPHLRTRPRALVWRRVGLPGRVAHPLRQADAEPDAFSKAVHLADSDDRVTWRGSDREGAAAVRVGVLGPRSDRLFVGEAGDHPVRSLRVELDEVGMHVDLVVVVVSVIVRELAREDDRCAVTHVGADRERLGRLRASLHRIDILAEDEDLAVKVSPVVLDLDWLFDSRDGIEPVLPNVVRIGHDLAVRAEPVRSSAGTVLS